MSGASISSRHAWLLLAFLTLLNVVNFVDRQLITSLQVPIREELGLTALQITVVVQRTTGVGYSGMYNTVGGQVTQTNSSTTNAITYVFTLNAGQTLPASTGRTFAIQTSGTGTAHPTAGDTYSISYTSGGQAFTTSGHF